MRAEWAGGCRGYGVGCMLGNKGVGLGKACRGEAGGDWWLDDREAERRSVEWGS